MKEVQLGDLTQKVASWNPATLGDAEFDYIDLSSVSSDTKSIEKVTRIRGGEAPSRARQVLRAGDVLVSTVRPNLNSVAQVATLWDGATGSTGFTVLRPTERLDARYLFHWVRARPFVADMVGRSTGANYPAVSDRIVKESTIPLPPLEEQRRIAVTLDRADQVRTDRRRTLTHLDSLTAAVFDSMFDRAMRSKSIGEVGRVTTGSTPPSSLDGMFGGPIPFVTPGDLESGAEVVRSLTAEGARQSRLVRPGATLVCCIGTIGKIATAAVECAFNQQINAIEWDREVVDDAYGFAAMKRLKPVLVSMGSATTLPLLPKGRFVGVEIPIPPMEEQQRFSAFASRVEQHHERVRRALQWDGRLFTSLQSRAFRGEL